MTRYVSYPATAADISFTGSIVLSIIGRIRKVVHRQLVRTDTSLPGTVHSNPTQYIGGTHILAREDDIGVLSLMILNTTRMIRTECFLQSDTETYLVFGHGIMM